MSVATDSPPILSEGVLDQELCRPYGRLEGRRPDARGRVSPPFQRGGRRDGVEAYRSRPRQLQGLGA